MSSEALHAHYGSSREANESQVPVVIAMLALLSAGGFAVTKEVESPLAFLTAWGGLSVAVILGAIYTLLRVSKGR